MGSRFHGSTQPNAQEKIMLRFAAPVAIALSLAACATKPAGQSVTVTGSITYRERIALPPTARIAVKLDDVSLADAPSRTLANQSFAGEGRQAPFAFALTIDRAAIAPATAMPCRRASPMPRAS